MITYIIIVIRTTKSSAPNLVGHSSYNYIRVRQVHFYNILVAFKVLVIRIRDVFIKFVKGTNVALPFLALSTISRRYVYRYSILYGSGVGLVYVIEERSFVRSNISKSRDVSSINSSY